MRLKDKVAIVTGAASGIGQAIGDLFVAEGAKVIYSDIHEEATHLALMSGQAEYVKCNVAERSEVEALVKATIDKFGHLDIMVNNAGVGTLGSILDVSDEVWETTIKVNLYGVFYGSQIAAQIMKEKNIKGSIVNISSILGTVGMASTVSYCASKGGVVQLTHAASLDLAPFGIRINAVAPGFIATKMTEGVLQDEAFNKMVNTNTPLGYVGESLDIAQAVLYLASDESKYVTGTVLHVDGGWTAH